MGVLNAAIRWNGLSFTGPSADGTNGQVLQTNGSAVTSWATPSSGIPTLGSSTDYAALVWNGTGGDAVRAQDVLLIDATGHVIARQSGGVAGTDEICIRHDGSNGTLDCRSGVLSHQIAGSTVWRVSSSGLSAGNYGNSSRVDIRSVHNAIIALIVRRNSSSSTAALIEGHNESGTALFKVTASGGIVATLPTSDPANAGELWSDSGTVKVSAG